MNFTIGETASARAAGEELQVLSRQLRAAAEAVPPGAWHRMAVAYEPVWAIGEGAEPCAPAEVRRVHQELRKVLKDFGEETQQRLGIEKEVKDENATV